MGRNEERLDMAPASKRRLSQHCTNGICNGERSIGPPHQMTFQIAQKTAEYIVYFWKLLASSMDAQCTSPWGPTRDEEHRMSRDTQVHVKRHLQRASILKIVRSRYTMLPPPLILFRADPPPSYCPSSLCHPSAFIIAALVFLLKPFACSFLCAHLSSPHSQPAFFRASQSLSTAWFDCVVVSMPSLPERREASVEDAVCATPMLCGRGSHDRRWLPF
jgi:hypothetical protein